jgi:hypothetical protein
MRTLISLAVAEAIAPLIVKLSRMEAELARRRPPLAAAPPVPPASKAAEVNAWLDAHGDLGAVVREVAKAHSVPVERLLSTERSFLVLSARRAAVVELTRRGLSSPDIGRILRRDHSSVLLLQKQAGVAAAHLPHGQRKAAA